MKFLLLLVSSVVIAYGCKPVDRSESETQSLRKIAKGLEAITVSKKLTDSLSVRQVVKQAVDDGQLEDLKKLLKKGGDLSDDVALAYYRAIKERKLLLHSRIREKNMVLSHIGDHPMHPEEITLIERTAKISAEIVEEYTSLVKRTTNQISEIVQSTTNDKMDTAISLCCRESKLTNTGLPKNKKAFGQVLNNSNNFGRSLDFGNDGALAASSRLDKYKNVDALYDPVIKARRAIHNFMELNVELSKTLKNYNDTLLETIPN